MDRSTDNRSAKIAEQSEKKERRELVASESSNIFCIDPKLRENCMPMGREMNEIHVCSLCPRREIFDAADRDTRRVNF